MTVKYTENGALPTLKNLTGRSEVSLEFARNVWDSLTSRIYFGEPIGEFSQIYEDLREIAFVMEYESKFVNRTLLASWNAGYLGFSVNQVDSVIQSIMDQVQHRKASLFNYHDSTIEGLIPGLGH